MTISERIAKLQTVPGCTTWVVTTGLKGGVVMRGSIPARTDMTLAGQARLGMLAELFDEGTKKYSRDALRNKLQALGATITFIPKVGRIEFEVIALSEHFEATCELLTEMLYRPTLSTASLATVRTKLLGQLNELRFDTRTQAREELTRALYPSDSPLYIGTLSAREAALKKVTRSELTAQHARMLKHAGVKLVVTGDISPSSVERLLKKYFKGASGEATTVISNATVPNSRFASKILTIPGRASVDTFWGLAPGISKEHPDFLPLMIGLQILGGGFMGRLMQEIREKRGLTYGIYARLSSFELKLSGYWFVWGTFAPQMYALGVKCVQEVLTEFVKNGVTEEEVRAKKERVMGAHKLSLGSSEELSMVLLALLEDGRAPEYVDSYLTEIAAVTRESVNTAIRRYCDPRKLIAVAAGSIDTKGKPLTA